MENKIFQLLEDVKPIILLSLFSSLAIAAGLHLLTSSLIIYPSFHLDSVHVSSFNISVQDPDDPFDTSSSSMITATWDIKFHLTNPSRFCSSIFYEPLDVSVNYGMYKIASALTPPFYQDAKTLYASITVEASSNLIDNMVAYHIARDYVHGVVDFNVKAHSMVHLRPFVSLWFKIVRQVRMFMQVFCIVRSILEEKGHEDRVFSHPFHMRLIKI